MPLDRNELQLCRRMAHPEKIGGCFSTLGLRLTCRKEIIDDECLQFGEAGKQVGLYIVLTAGQTFLFSATAHHTYQYCCCA